MVRLGMENLWPEANPVAQGQKGGSNVKFNEFMGKTRSGELPHVFLLAGEEHYYLDKARERILGRLFPEGGQQDGLEKLKGEVSPVTLAGMLEEVPFFTPRHIVIVEDSTLLRPAKKGADAEAEDKDKAPAGRKRGGKDEPLAQLIATLQNMPDYSYCIFISHARVDKRKKLYKAIDKAGLVLEADPIRAWNINEWLQGKLQSLNKDMDRDAEAYFSAAVSMMQTIDLGYLDQQLDMVAMYSRDRRISRAELVSVFAGLPEVSVFALLDAVSQRNVRRALALLRRQLADGTYFTVILVLLTRHVRQLWQAQVLQAKGIRGKALAKQLELNPYIAERVGRAAAGFSAQALKNGLLELIDADYTLKTGQAGNEVLEHAIITLCQ